MTLALGTLRLGKFPYAAGYHPLYIQWTNGWHLVLVDRP
jgi:hypothetical protein